MRDHGPNIRRDHVTKGSPGEDDLGFFVGLLVALLMGMLFCICLTEIGKRL